MASSIGRTVPAHLALFGVDQAEDAPHRGGLARTIGSEETEDSSGMRIEAEPIERCDITEPLVQIVENEHVCLRLLGLSSAAWASRLQMEEQTS